jgi:hypothetical protein
MPQYTEDTEDTEQQDNTIVAPFSSELRRSVHSGLPLQAK